MNTRALALDSFFFLLSHTHPSFFPLFAFFVRGLVLMGGVFEMGSRPIFPLCSFLCRFRIPALLPRVRNGKTGLVIRTIRVTRPS